jgi:fibronectin-binding autotransporter adhesin
MVAGRGRFGRVLVLTAMLAAGGAGRGAAAPYTWLVSGSNLLGSWDTAANWNPSGVPTAGDSVVVSQDLIGTGTIRYFGLSGTVATSGTQQIDSISVADTNGTGSLRFSAGGTTAYLQFATTTPSVTANIGGSGSNLTIDNPLFQPSTTLTKSGSGIVQLVFNDAETANSFSTNVPLVDATGGASLALWNLSGVPLALPNVSFYGFNTGLTIRAGLNTVAAGRSLDLGGAGNLGVGSGGTLTFDPGSTLTAGNLITTTGNSSYLYMGGDSTVNWNGDTATLATIRMGEQALYGSRTSTVNVSSGVFNVTASPSQSWLGNPSAEANQVRTYTLNLNVNGGLMQFTNPETVERNFTVGWNRLNTVNVGTGTSTVNATITVSSGTLDMGPSGRIILGDRLPNSGTAAGFVNSRINLDGGMLRVAQNIARGNSNTTNGGMTSTFVFNGGTLQLAGTPALRLINANVDTLVAGGGAIVDTNGFSTNIAAGLIESPSSPGGGLTKLGEGVLALAGTNTYAGPTVISGGTLAVGGTNAVSGGFGLLNAGNYAASISVASGAGFVFSNSDAAATQTLSGDITGEGSLAKLNAAALILTGTGSALGGSVTFNGGSTTIDPGPGGSFTAAGRFQMAAPALGSATLAVASGTNAFSSAAGIIGIGDNAGSSTLTATGGSTTFTIDANRMLVGNKGTGAIVLDGGAVTITGSQAVIIGGDIQYALDNATGLVTVNSGTLAVLGDGPLLLGVNASGEQFANTTNANGTITLNGGVFAASRPITAFSGTNPSSGVVNFNGGTLRAMASSTSMLAVTSANVQDGGAVIDTNGFDVTIDRPLVAAGAGGLTKLGSGTLVLAAANTLTGSTTVQAGVLQLANGSALSASRLVVVAGGTGQVAPVTSTSVAGLDLASGNGLLDLTSGALTISSGMTPTELVAEILEGRGDGSWNGTSGITSSTAAAQVASSIPRAVGWVDNGDGSLTTAYAAPGDTNIDWSIDILDASNFLAGGKFDTGSVATWIEGDFSYDGVVDILDAADFFATGLYDAGNYNTGSGLSGSVAAVPEPAGMAILAAAMVCAGVAGRHARRTLARRS